VDIRVGDVLAMKKPHPCGETHFTVGRVGMDFRIRCNGCGHEVMVPRAKWKRTSKRFSGMAWRLTKMRSGNHICSWAAKIPANVILLNKGVHLCLISWILLPRDTKKSTTG
jgi:hypothetical protein